MRILIITFCLANLLIACKSGTSTSVSDSTGVTPSGKTKKMVAESVKKNTPDSSWFCHDIKGRFETRWIKTSLGKQKMKVVYSDTIPKAGYSRLIVFLHGDSPFRNPSYQYNMAGKIHRTFKNSVAVGILRPGYTDGCGDRSEGDKGKMMGDNYNAKVVESLAKVLEKLQLEFSPQKTILIGHSGGAALSALFASRYPDLSGQTFLLACPCDLLPWRQNMKELTKNEQWLQPLPGLSAIDEVAKLDSSKQVVLFVGDKDKVAPASLSKAYANAATKAGKKVVYRLMPGINHNGIIKSKPFTEILKSIN